MQVRNEFWKNLRQGRSAAHRAVRRDLIILGLLVFVLGLLWFSSFGKGMAVGALLMFLPRLWTDIGAWLDIEVVWERYGPPPRKPRGRHHTHHGSHPRPGARNQG